jgi:cbb3-type cytochrome c oxidase subunit II
MRPARVLRMSYLVAGIGGIGFFAMSVLLLAVWPGRVLERETAAMSPDHPLPLTASELRGRAIYSREGCAYCHTQQVRYLQSDVSRFGAATLAWETNFDYPQLWGTRRIGPDLSREASVRSDDWQLSHLYAPRSIVRDSVMPSFPRFFEGAPDRPKQEARDLLAYLKTLGRDRELAAPEGEARARAACAGCSADVIRFAFDAPLSGNPSTPRRTGDHPQLAAGGDKGLGDDLYRHNCAGCHGTSGKGDGPGAAGLSPRPPDFTQHEYTLERLSSVMWNGSAGSAMPAWRDRSVADLSALAASVQSFYAERPEPQLPAGIMELGARAYKERCAQCHGDNGAGDGFAAAQFAIAPTNFREQRPTIAASLRAVREGVAGTRMGPWALKLPDAEVSAPAYYVRTFFQGGQPQ